MWPRAAGDLSRLKLLGAGELLGVDVPGNFGVATDEGMDRVGVVNVGFTEGGGAGKVRWMTRCCHIAKKNARMAFQRGQKNVPHWIIKRKSHGGLDSKKICRLF